jgi:chromosomal replication initiation ATPase DnaA
MFGVDSEQILTKGKKTNQARDGTIYLCRRLTRLSGSELEQYFGNVSGAAIAMRCKAVSAQMQRGKRLQRRVKRLEGKILDD